jgi:LCP family protein required for cell wall assembly
MSKIARKPKKTPVWKKILGGIFYLSVCAIALLLGTGAQYIGRSPVLQDYVDQFLRNKSAEEVWERDQVTLLILGCDEDRAYRGPVTRAYARSDMMLVARIDFKNKKVGAVSIPRDLEVQLPDYRAQKINAYHSIGGPDLAKQAAESVVGVPIHKVIVLNYDAFKEMVDTAGGIEVYVPKKMDYDDNAGNLHVHLKPGRQKLDGYAAMGYVRFRHDAMSDFARQGRQKDFMLAFKEQLKKNPGLIPDVTNKAYDVLNRALSTAEVAALGRYMQSVPNDNIKMGQIPVLEGRGSNLLLDSEKLYEVLATNYIIDAPITSVERVSRR